MTEKVTDKTREKSRRDGEADPTAPALPGFSLPGIFEGITQSFDEFLQPFLRGSMRSVWSELGAKEPSIDLQDRGDHYVLTAELPGFEKNDVEVRIGARGLELKGEKKMDKESKNREGTQLVSSRSVIHRYLALPEEVVSEKAGGTMKNGVLELKLPKKERWSKDRSMKVDLK